MQLRAIDTADWDAILEIQEECYSMLEPEPLAVLQSKWQVSAQSCFVIEHKGDVVGYCLAHPWTAYTPPVLYQELKQLPEADSLYLHDIAISKRAQGLGAGSQSLKHLHTIAQRLGLSSLSLVAVQGADSYWQKMGFSRQNIAKSLTSYTDDACYMMAPIQVTAE